MADKAAETAETIADTTRRTGETVARGYGEPFPVGRDGMEGLTRAGQAMLDGTAELGQLWAAFWSEQLADGTDALRALTTCRSWREAVEIQNEFTRASLERVCAQAARSAELTTAMIAGGTKPLQESIHRGAERTPRAAE
jgi:hypothetical protein